MIELFGLGVLLLIVWMLFIKGALFRIILAVFAFIGMRTYLWANYLNSHDTFMTVAGYTVSWATLIPSIVIVLAMATTSVSKND